MVIAIYRGKDIDNKCWIIENISKNSNLLNRLKNKLHNYKSVYENINKYQKYKLQHQNCSKRNYTFYRHSGIEYGLAQVMKTMGFKIQGGRSPKNKIFQCAKKGIKILLDT